MKNEINSLLRNDLLSFGRKALRRLEGITLSHDRYVELLASELSAFAEGRTKRLLVNLLSPRDPKILLGSVCLAAWILGHSPTTKIMLLACSEKLAEKFSRQIRSIMSAQGIRKSSRHGLRRAMPRRWTLKLKTAAACSPLHSMASSPGLALKSLLSITTFPMLEIRDCLTTPWRPFSRSSGQS